MFIYFPIAVAMYLSVKDSKDTLQLSNNAVVLKPLQSSVDHSILKAAAQTPQVFIVDVLKSNKLDQVTDVDKPTVSKWNKNLNGNKYSTYEVELLPENSFILRNNSKCINYSSNKFSRGVCSSSTTKFDIWYEVTTDMDLNKNKIDSEEFNKKIFDDSKAIKENPKKFKFGSEYKNTRHPEYNEEHNKDTTNLVPKWDANSKK